MVPRFFLFYGSSRSKWFSAGTTNHDTEVTTSRIAGYLPVLSNPFASLWSLRKLPAPEFLRRNLNQDGLVAWREPRKIAFLLGNWRAQGFDFRTFLVELVVAVQATSTVAW